MFLRTFSARTHLGLRCRTNTRQQMMRLILRVLAISGAAVAIAVLAVAFVSAETEPIARAIVLDGAIDRSPADPVPTTDGGTQPPPAITVIEQIEPGPHAFATDACRHR